MRLRFASILAIAFLLIPGMLAAAPAPTPSLETFLSSLPAPPAPDTAPGAPTGVPKPQWSATCSEILQACLAGCGGNPSCELLCRCDYYECRGWEIPNYCN